MFRHETAAIMQSTSFGNIVLGNFNVFNSSLFDYKVLNVTENIVNESANILKALNKFWQSEEANKNDNKFDLTWQQEEVEKVYRSTTYREDNGRYVVTMPMAPKNIGNNM